MRRIFRILTILSVLYLGYFPNSRICAQSPVENTEETSEPTVLEKIVEESEGNVYFEIPESIEAKILSTPSVLKKKGNGKKKSEIPKHGIIKKEGFRVQIFNDGRNQGSLEARAKARGNAVASRFPKYRGQIYTFSSAPNWFCRVGNFKTHAEAYSALTELKRAFPAFAGEMRVVKCQIVLVQ